MAGLHKKKTGTNQTSWEFYIEGNKEWLENPLRCDIDGDLVGPDGRTVAYRFKKGESLQILNIHLEKIDGKELAKVRVNGIVGWTQIKNISKPTTIKLTSDSGERHQERQETAVIQAIREAILANGGEPITIMGHNKTKIEGVIGASKNSGTNAYGKEQYADMLLSIKGKEFGVSMKMERAPTLFGGGYMALFNIDPKFISKLMLKALDAAIKDKDFELGSTTKLKDIFIEISNKKFLEAALVGNEKMGGPIQYMFIGKQFPKYEFSNGVLKFLDSSFYTIKQYKTKIPKFYIRIRRRDTTQYFTNELDKQGLPLFFKSRMGQERARIVIDKVVSGRGLKILDH